MTLREMHTYSKIKSDCYYTTIIKHSVELSQGVDEWCWKIEENGMFSVRSIYKKLEALTALDEVSGEETRVFTQVWKCAAPSKVVALSGKLCLIGFQRD